MFNVPILTVPYASFLVSHPGFGFEHYRHYRLKQIRAEPALPAQTDSSRTHLKFTFTAIYRLALLLSKNEFPFL